MDVILHLHQPRSDFVSLSTLLTFKRIVRCVTIHNNFENLVFSINYYYSLIFRASRVSFVSQSSFDSFPKTFLRMFSKK